MANNVLPYGTMYIYELGISPLRFTVCVAFINYVLLG